MGLACRYSLCVTTQVLAPPAGGGHLVHLDATTTSTTEAELPNTGGVGLAATLASFPTTGTEPRQWGP